MMCVCVRVFVCAHMRPQAELERTHHTHWRDNRFAAAQNDLLNIYEALRRHGFYPLALG